MIYDLYLDINHKTRIGQVMTNDCGEIYRIDFVTPLYFKKLEQVHIDFISFQTQTLKYFYLTEFEEEEEEENDYDPNNIESENHDDYKDTQNV